MRDDIDLGLTAHKQAYAEGFADTLEKRGARGAMLLKALKRLKPMRMPQQEYVNSFMRGSVVKRTPRTAYYDIADGLKQDLARFGREMRRSNTYVPDPLASILRRQPIRALAEYRNTLRALRYARPHIPPAKPTMLQRLFRGGKKPLSSGEAQRRISEDLGTYTDTDTILNRIRNH